MLLFNPSKIAFVTFDSIKFMTPFQCFLMVFAAFIIGSSLEWVAQKYHLFRYFSATSLSLFNGPEHLKTKFNIVRPYGLQIHLFQIAESF